MQILRRKQQAQHPALVVIVSDLHINSAVALLDGPVPLDDGGTYHPSKAQRWIWRCWQDFWQQVEKIDKSELYVVINGDAVEGEHHGTTQIITRNLDTQLGVVTRILEPVAQLADYLFIVRGTEAHTGPSAYWEEHLAKDLTCVVQDEVTASWWHLPLEVEGVTFDIAHHPQTAGRLPHTKDSAASRQAAIVWQEYHEIDEKPPDVVIRSHVHYFARGYSRETLAVQCPPWKLCDAFGRRLGTGRRIEPVGGVVFQCQDGHYTWYPIRYKPLVRRAWTSVNKS